MHFSRLLPYFAVIGIGIVVVIAIFLFSVAESRNNSGESTTNPMTNFENFKPMTFSAVNVSVTDAKNLHEKVCQRSITFRPTYIPEKINFAYLEPKYQVFMIACEHGPAGIWKEHYAMSENNEVMPLNKDIFQIETPWQAIEYLTLVNYIDSGEPEIGNLIVSTEEYKHTCGSALHESIPLSVIALGDHYLVNMTHTVYSDYPVYPCVFQKFDLSKNGSYSQISK